MSLLSLIRTKDVAARLKPFRPATRKVTAPLLVPPGGGSPTLAGSAFDYLLRFELHRRAPHAKDRQWVAELVPDFLYHPGTRPGTWIGRDLLRGKETTHPYMGPKEASEKTRAVCESARRALADYLGRKTADPGAQRTLAAWAVKLAKVEAVSRGNVLDITFEEAPTELVEDLVALLAVVPFDRLIHPLLMLLNPIFGDSSALVGGADADLIAGDMLVDFKTTKAAEVKGDYLDQLFGYFLLARRARATDPGIPEIGNVGLYFSRHGHLWTHDTPSWVNRAEFAETERWFFERARELFPARAAQPPAPRG